MSTSLCHTEIADAASCYVAVDELGAATAVPDLATLRRVPWLEGTALVLCDVLDHHTHAEVPHSPRAVLKRQIARLEAMGMKDKAIDLYRESARMGKKRSQERLRKLGLLTNRQLDPPVRSRPSTSAGLSGITPPSG